MIPGCSGRPALQWLLVGAGMKEREREICGRQTERGREREERVVVEEIRGGGKGDYGQAP